MDDSVKRVEIKVQPRSGFDKSLGSMGTSKCGLITPIFVDEVIPNSKVNLKIALSATLPPLASESFMKCSVKCEAFFVPMRLLFGSFENWFCDDPLRYADGTTSPSCPPVMLLDSTHTAGVQRFLQIGGLADYLGYRTPSTTDTSYVIPAMPFLAYHRIYDDWYRRADVQTPVFRRPKPGAVTPQNLKSAPFQTYDQSSYLVTITSTTNENLGDTVSVFNLRYRNFDQDYFTVARTSEQFGPARSVTIQTSGGTDYFTIASLRNQNSLQQFAERNNLVTPREVEVVKARYGADLSDGVAQRALLIGAAEFELYTKGIYTNAASSSSTNNPFAGEVASQYGSAYASGSDFIIQGFTANEPGYIFVNATMVPRVTYSSGVRRYLMNYQGPGCIVDMPNPLLQNTGNEPIYQRELTGELANTGVFGYVERYSWFKTRESELHGLLRDGQSLSAFALQRNFAPGSNPTVGTSFIRIPANYMDQVEAVTGNISNYGWWYDAHFDYKVSMPLSKFSIPSLQDPAYEHGYTVNMKRNGVSL